MTVLILGAVKGKSKQTILNEITLPTLEIWNQRPLAPAIANIASGSYQRKEPPEIKGTGYVVDSLEAALWAFYKSENFEEGALMAVNLGDDADTTGAIYGAHQSLIVGYAEQLFKLADRITV